MIIIATVQADFVTSAKGKCLLRVNGYTYHKIFASNGGLKVRWRCSTHWARGCRAHVHTIMNEIIKITDQHDHPPPFTSSKSAWS
ncbi:hypothetical protein MSG28_008208 [Choristoneura fumiferana]|uniref:Uncharacterized protein n=1 Tax=Choristoneura fumiferana TaxID=7141 RepID=A0ACC0JAF9_CHOFU|nr:hypothetical protein MSG28_008208 [Choristoneura fumiferana]